MHSREWVVLKKAKPVLPVPNGELHWGKDSSLSPQVLPLCISLQIS